MKEDQKLKNISDLGWWGSHKVIGNVTVSWSPYDFLFTLHRNCPYLVPFRRYNKLFVKSHQFFLYCTCI